MLHMDSQNEFTLSTRTWIPYVGKKYYPQIETPLLVKDLSNSTY